MAHRMFFCVTLALLLAPAASGQPPAAAEPGIATELARLNETLSDIKVLLERAAETQGLDLLMKRMELSEARVTETEKRLRDAESRRASLEDERARMETNMRAYLTELESGTIDVSPGELEAFNVQYEAGIERLTNSLKSLDDEIAMLAADLSAKRRELEDWQAYIDRRLGGV